MIEAAKEEWFKFDKAEEFKKWKVADITEKERQYQAKWIADDVAAKKAWGDYQMLTPGEKAKMDRVTDRTIQQWEQANSKFQESEVRRSQQQQSTPPLPGPHSCCRYG